ncbi:MAG: universal stress protein [archaeon]|nr:universal stress protein [archaeon]
MTGKILVTTDGTESNRVAVDKAIDLAIENGYELYAITVYNTMSKDAAVIGEANITSDSVKSYCRKALLYAKQAAEARGVPIKTIMAQGTPSDVVIDISGNYDIVICGKTGKRVLHKSVSHRIEKFAHADVRVYAQS